MANKKEPIDKVADAGIYAAAGGATGAGVVAVFGNMGLAVAGGAIGIGMFPVAAAGAVAGLAVYGVKQAMED